MTTVDRPLPELPAEEHEHFELDPATTIDRARATNPVIQGLFTGLLGTQTSPWLIVVVRFEDDPRPVHIPGVDPLAHHRKLFTATGAGTMNMVRYFRDMSHGKLNTGGSVVVGPFTIGYDRAAYVGNSAPGPGQIDRGGVLAAGRAAATAHQIDLSSYAGIVVCGYELLDLCGWVGGMAALCDSHSLVPSLLGQEMGHGYGLDHSRVDTSTEDYQDPWDTMSTANAYSASDPDYGSIGPGLNAWNMRMRGWLDEGRVVRIDPMQPAHREIELGPLHDSGPAAAAIDVGEYLIEFRMADRWDAGIPRSAVLVHRAEANRSYLMAGSDGSHDLVAGVKFEHQQFFGPSFTATVESIDEATRRARIRIDQTVRRPRVPQAGVQWPPPIGDPGPVEIVDPRVAQLQELVGRYRQALAVSDRYGAPQLLLRALGELAEEVGRQAADTEVTTFHEGYSFEPKSVIAEPAPG